MQWAAVGDKTCRRGVRLLEGPPLAEGRSRPSTALRLSIKQPVARSHKRCLLSAVQMLLDAHFGKGGVPIARLNLSVAIAEYLGYLARMFLNVLSKI
jgi:hypothetical protein